MIGIVFALLAVAAAASGFLAPSSPGRSVFWRGRRRADRFTAVPVVLAAVATGGPHRGARDGTRVETWFPERRVQARAQRVVGGADCVGRIHHRFGRRLSKGRRGTAGDHASGTGGYALVATSEIPLVHNPNEPSGREALIAAGSGDSSSVMFTRFRVRPGDDASCLNLYRRPSPTIVAPENGFHRGGAFLVCRQRSPSPTRSAPTPGSSSTASHKTGSCP